MDSFGGNACEECGSQEFHDEDGRTVCENGHIQVGGLRIAEGDDEFGTQGKKIRKKEERSTIKSSKVFRGKKGYRLFLQAYQFILWKQCYALVQDKGLPSELWTVVRDLWTLRLSRLTNRFDGSSAPDEEDTGPPSTEESGQDSQGEQGQKATSATDATKSPTVLETVALCYLGILLLRVPVKLSTIFDWIRTDDIPYFRVIRQIPTDMTTRMPGEYMTTLDTHFAPKRDDLQLAVFQLSKMYIKSFQMSIPAINSNLLLFDFVRDLTLPLEIYSAAKRLTEVVGFKFKFSSTKARRKAISFPEAQLMSLLVIAVKITYPFDLDSVRRFPRIRDEPATQRLDWEAWIETHKQLRDDGNETKVFRKGGEYDVEDMDVFNLSGQQLDDYMDWYQKMWTPKDPPEGRVTKDILDMFPLKLQPYTLQNPEEQRGRENEIRDALRKTQASLRYTEPVPDNDPNTQDFEVLRPGMRYCQYRTVADLDQHKAARAFYDAAAETACLSLETLLRAVLQTESKIAIWRKGKRRAEVHGEEMDLDAEAGLVSQIDGLDGLDMLDGSLGLGNVGEMLDLEDSGSDMDVIT